MIDLITKWVVTALAMLGVLYFSFEAGYVEYVISADQTYLSIVMMGLVSYYFMKVGIQVFKNNITMKLVDAGFELAGNLMTLGMIGTVIGFITMSSSFIGVDFSDVENIKQLFKLASTGMSTALVTTLMGLITSLFVRSTAYTLELELEDEGGILELGEDNG